MTQYPIAFVADPTAYVFKNLSTCKGGLPTEGHALSPGRTKTTFYFMTTYEIGTNLKQMSIGKICSAIFYFIFIASSMNAQSIQQRLGYPENAKLIILHADDLGVSHSLNAASIATLEKGCVNSASIMVPCPWFLEIAEYAKNHRDADFGVHITLNSEWSNFKWAPVSEGQHVRSLIDKRGFMHASVDSAIQFAKASEVEHEMRNQVKRALEFGIDVTHLDAHMFTAMRSPEFLKSYIKIGREFRVPVFIPRDAQEHLKVNLESLITSKDVIFDHVVTIMPKQMQDNPTDFYINSLKNLKPGLNYFIIHTANDDDEMRAVTKGAVNWGSAWCQTEYDFFSTAQVCKILKENNVYLITWREIREKITRK